MILIGVVGGICGLFFLTYHSQDREALVPQAPASLAIVHFELTTNDDVVYAEQS
jgi:hypothetical protein